MTDSDTIGPAIPVHEEAKLQVQTLTEKAPKIEINDSLRAEEVDLRTLVGHQTAVQTKDTVESVFAAFAKDNVEFTAVLDGARLVGLCSRHQISELLGGRYGFSLWARKPIGQHLSPNEIRVSVTTPIGDVLKKVFARSDDSFYDDVLLIDGNESFLGLITTQTLFEVQNALLRTNIRDLVEKEREIQAKNEQTQMDLRMAMELQQACMSVTYPLFPPSATVETTKNFFFPPLPSRQPDWRRLFLYCSSLGLLRWNLHLRRNGSRRSLGVDYFDAPRVNRSCWTGSSQSRPIDGASKQRAHKHS